MSERVAARAQLESKSHIPTMPLHVYANCAPRGAHMWPITLGIIPHLFWLLIDCYAAHVAERAPLAAAVIISRLSQSRICCGAHRSGRRMGAWWHQRLRQTLLLRQLLRGPACTCHIHRQRNDTFRINVMTKLEKMFIQRP